jgi:hypothetical protein
MGGPNASVSAPLFWDSPGRVGSAEIGPVETALLAANALM